MSSPKSHRADASNAVARSDQRKHPRFGVEAIAKVNVLGSTQVFEGQIGDLSQSGLRITVPVVFPNGEILRVEAGDEVFVAVVCHSSRTLGGYTLGVEMMHSIKRVHLDALVREWSVD